MTVETHDCPSCKTRLNIPPWIRSPSFTCPRCLAKIANPFGAPPLNLPCPYCAEEIPSTAAVCPRCREPLYADLELEAGRDTSKVRWLLIVLVVLGALGVLQFAAGYGASVSKGWGVTLSLLFVGILGAGIFLNSRKEDPIARGIGRTVLGAFAVAGGLVILGVVVAVAAVVCLFAVCFFGDGKF